MTRIVLLVDEPARSTIEQWVDEQAEYRLVRGLDADGNGDGGDHTSTTASDDTPASVDDEHGSGCDGTGDDGRPALVNHIPDHDSFDICILDRSALVEHRAEIRAAKEAAAPVDRPCLLVYSGPPDDEREDGDEREPTVENLLEPESVPESEPESVPQSKPQSESESEPGSEPESNLGQLVDDVLRTPISTVELGLRLDTLVEKRETKAALAAHREEQSLFRSAVDHAGHSIYITETDGTIRYVNQAFESVTGYTEDEAIGKTPRILKSGEYDKTFYGELWRTILGGDVWERDIVNRRKNGELYRVNQTIAPITDDDGTVRFFVAVNTDVTDRTIREQQKQVLNRILRHNLRNYVNVVSGHVEQLVADPAVGTDDHETEIESIREASRRLIEVSRKASMLTSIFTDRGGRNPQSITEIVKREKARITNRYPTAKIRVEPPAESLWVSGTVTFAIREALENAVEHNDRTPVEVTVRAATSSEGSEWVVVDVVDDGPGIPDAERVVLERGTESPLSHGSGLGLWLIKWIVMRAGGKVSIERRTPRGSRIQFLLPNVKPGVSDVEADGVVNGDGSTQDGETGGRRETEDEGEGEGEGEGESEGEGEGEGESEGEGEGEDEGENGSRGEKEHEYESEHEHGHVDEGDDEEDSEMKETQCEIVPDDVREREHHTENDVRQSQNETPSPVEVEYTDETVEESTQTPGQSNEGPSEE